MLACALLEVVADEWCLASLGVLFLVVISLEMLFGCVLDGLREDLVRTVGVRFAKCLFQLLSSSKEVLMHTVDISKYAFAFLQAVRKFLPVPPNWTKRSRSVNGGFVTVESVMRRHLN